MNAPATLLALAEVEPVYDTAPLAIDLFCGLGGWTEGLLAEGYRVIGFDIEAHAYGDERYPAELVLEDVLAIDGARFAEADLIVASPPCQEYSYMAMPWSRAKAKAAAIRADETGAELERLNRLFNASFRIQREASAAAGRRIPLVVENVRGAIPWVGRSRWNFGSYHLWGDVPALMPVAIAATKVPGFRFDGVTKRCFQETAALVHGLKPPARVSVTAPADGRKGVGSGAEWFDQNISSLPSSSPRRKAASAKIAKIPLTLSRWIAAHYLPARAATQPVSGAEGE